MRTSIIAFLALLAFAAADKQCGVSDVDKTDCGFVGINQQQCESKGCCWVPVQSSSNPPWCFQPAGASVDCFKVSTSTNAPFSDSEVQTMRNYFKANLNIEGRGGVVAAPDRNTPGGSYYYHWERDAALSMRAFMTTSSNFSEYDSYMKSWVGWVTRVQAESDPNGIDIRSEVKFNLPNGDVFTGGWCRPQNDGPGLTATTLMMYAEELMNQGQSNYVKQYLWTNDNNRYHGGAIKYALDWIPDGWSSTGCDLWEEIRSSDLFWNRLTARRALLQGAAFADKMGDSSSASRYRSTASEITNDISRHYNGAFVFESDNRQKDSAVISAFNEGAFEGDSLFGPTDSRVGNTIKVLNKLFCNSYTINQKDTEAGIAGVLYGRYQGDSYAGGNPWVLLTASLAELFYRGAQATLKSNAMPKDPAPWYDILGIKSNAALTPFEFSRNLASAGDGVMERLAYHVRARGFHLDEQIDRNSGAQCSAKDLTWSYANVLKAMKARQTYKEVALAGYRDETTNDAWFH